MLLPPHVQCPPHTKCSPCTASQSWISSPGGSLTTSFRSKPALRDAFACRCSWYLSVPCLKLLRGRNVWNKHKQRSMRERTNEWTNKRLTPCYEKHTVVWGFQTWFFFLNTSGIYQWNTIIIYIKNKQTCFQINILIYISCPSWSLYIHIYI